METTTKQALKFELFGGRTHVEMPKLIASGFVPSSAAQIMRGRLEGKLDWDDSDFASGDVIVYHPDGRVKLVYDSEDLRRLAPPELSSNPEEWGTWASIDKDLRRLTREQSYGLVLPDCGAWESLDGRVFDRDEIAKYAGKYQSKDSAKGNPFWQWLSRGDHGLLGAYVDQMFSRINSLYSRDNAMAISVAQNNPNIPVPSIRLWSLGGATNSSGGGNANGVYHLVFDCTNTLVGVKEPGSAKRKYVKRRY